MDGMGPAWERDLLQSVLDRAGKAHLAYLDRDFNFVWVNQTYAASCGYLPGEMTGKNHFALYPHPENERIFSQVRDTGEIFEIKDRPFSYPDQPERGVTYWDWTLNPVKDPDGKVTGLVFSLYETTERKRLEEELKNYNETLEDRVNKRTEELKKQQEHLERVNKELMRSNKELENFAYVASHDLQEPLRMITSFTQLLSLRYKDKLDDNANDYIQFAVDGAKRMYELINSLLAYSGISRKETTFSSVDLNKIIDVVKANLNLVINEKNVKIEIDKLPVVYADANQMTQLFQNLISNAIKFSNANPHIIISSKTRNSHRIISVRDNGIGIDPVYFNRIFELFKRLMPRDKYEGTGIGLAICKRIVENHNGTIWVESEPGKGSVFHFSLPKSEL